VLRLEAVSSLGRGPNSPMPDIVETQPEIEECDLPEAATESELAVAERLLAALLVRSWLREQPNCPEALRGVVNHDRGT